MWLLVAALLSQQQPVPARGDTAPPPAHAGVHVGTQPDSARRHGTITLSPREQAGPQPVDTTGAYLDAGAAQLVRGARERRRKEDARIRAYDVALQQRLSVGLKGLARERLLVAQDLAARIHWQRNLPTRVEVVGARQVAPVVARGVQPADRGAVENLADLLYDPRDDRLRLGGVLEGGFIRHPLAPGSEAHYRFEAGDTTAVRLPDGRTIRLLELRIVPRRPDPHLLNGSLWIDAATMGVVRGVFRLARDWEMELKYSRDAADPKAQRRIAGLLLEPMRAEMRYLTLEYALVDLHWWMPRLMAFEGSVQLAGRATVPLRYERTFSGYQVRADSAGGAPLAAHALPPDPKACRASHPGLRCVCSLDDCRLVDVRVPTDTLALIHSAELPPPPADAYEASPGAASPLQEIGDRLGRIPQRPWQAGAAVLHWGAGRAGLLRFNRVEGLSLGTRADWDLGRLRADATVRLGLAPAPADSSPAIRLTPDLVAGLTHESPSSSYRLAGYRRTEAMDPSTRPLGFGNSFNAFFFGRDDGLYFRAAGLELTRHAALGGREHLGWRLFAERQSPLSLGTQWNLRRLFGAEPGFRPNPAAERADEVGGELALRYGGGTDGGDLRWEGRLGLEAALGTFDFARPSAGLQLAFPLPFGLAGATEAAVGTSGGTVPLQRSWFLGGPATLRGYDGGTLAGQAFWRARAEAGKGPPGARLVLFTDAGWAGPRADFGAGRPLQSVGVGGSFLGGALRLDLARALRRPTGWRLDFYLDGIL